jgi:hypothetical protein
MGIGTQDLDVLLRLREEGYIPDRASIIEIGAQQLANSFLEAPQKIEAAGRCFRANGDLSLPDPTPSFIVHGRTEHLDAAAPLARDFWRWLGFDYASVDIDESPGSIPLDLNYDDAPASAVGKYQLVTNFGTTEHVANQLNAFKVIHELTAIGGVMWHHLPAQGMLNHGLVNYNPKFFWMLARSNGYKLVYLNYSGPSIYYELPANIIDNVVAFDPGVRERLKDVRVSDAGVVVALQKVFDIPFVAPLDVTTGATTNNSVLAARYWTVFKPNAFRSVVFQGSRKYLVARALQYIRLAFGRTMILRLVRKAPGFRTARAIRARLRGDWREVAASPPAPAAASEMAPPQASAVPAAALKPADYAGRQAAFVNRMEPHANLFDGVTPWSGAVPKSFLVDFSGALTDAHFRTMFGIDPEAVGGGAETTRLPVIEDGEGWFEGANWVLAARESRDHFVMITLGACYGAQAVGSYRMLQQLNPMPCKLVAVEPVPENYQWIARHFRDNGIDPAAHWLVPLAIAANNEPVLFPIGAPGSGAQNAVATNNKAAREYYVDVFTRAGAEPAKVALRNLLLHNTTGITRDLVEGYDFKAEIKLVSAITLHELLSPFERVDYLESDIQQSEIEVFPPFIDLLRKKVRRIHIGTHGKEVHWTLHDLFEGNGWEIVFSFEPNAHHDTILGSFDTNDGVLTVRNPDF